MQVQCQYASKQSFMKIEFENSIFELSTGHQNCLDKIPVNDETNFIENQYLPGLLMSWQGLLHVNLAV